MFNCHSYLGNPFLYPEINHPMSAHYTELDYFDSTLWTRSDVRFEDLVHKKIILFAGDSFTFGLGLKYKDTFSNIIHQEMFSNDEYIVVNVGYPGSSNDFISMRIQQWVNAFPKNIAAIIIGFSFLARRLHYTNITDNFYLNSEMIDITEDMYKFNPANNVNSKLYYAYLETQSYINDLRNLERILFQNYYMSKAMGIKVYWFSLFHKQLSESDCKVITTHFDKEDFTYINIEDIEIPIISPTDGHWNEDGNKVIANLIMDRMKLDF